MKLREAVRALLAENGRRCNADGRRYVAERIINRITPRELNYILCGTPNFFIRFHSKVVAARMVSCSSK